MSPAGIPCSTPPTTPQTALDETIDPLRTRATAATIGVFRTTETSRIVDLDLLPEMPSADRCVEPDERPVEGLLVELVDSERRRLSLTRSRSLAAIPSA